MKCTSVARGEIPRATAVTHQQRGTRNQQPGTKYPPEWVHLFTRRAEVYIEGKLTVPTGAAVGSLGQRLSPMNAVAGLYEAAHLPSMRQLLPITRDSLTAVNALRSFANSSSEAPERLGSCGSLTRCLVHPRGWDTAFTKGDLETFARLFLLGKRRLKFGFLETEAVHKAHARIPIFACNLLHMSPLRRTINHRMVNLAFGIRA